MRILKPLIFILLTIGFFVPVYGQNNISISGHVLDTQTNLPIPYATIYNKTNQSGTITNDDGYFKLAQLSVNDTLVFSFVGYEKLQIVVSKPLINYTFSLQPKTEILGEFVITA